MEFVADFSFVPLASNLPPLKLPGTRAGDSGTVSQSWEKTDSDWKRLRLALSAAIFGPSQIQSINHGVQAVMPSATLDSRVNSPSENSKGLRVGLRGG